MKLQPLDQLPEATRQNALRHLHLRQDAEPSVTLAAVLAAPTDEAAVVALRKRIGTGGYLGGGFMYEPHEAYILLGWGHELGWDTTYGCKVPWATVVGWVRGTTVAREQLALFS